jgi:hypothetical protein
MRSDLMLICEEEIDLPRLPDAQPGAAAEVRTLLSHLDGEVRQYLDKGAQPLRFAVTGSSAAGYRCELGVLSGPGVALPGGDSIFRFVHRGIESADRFVAALAIPTGIGAEIGGHAGDANPVARLLAGACDLLITHPNVVNASDINELPENGLYVEGSVLCRLLMGTVGLQPVRSNRVLVLVDGLTPLRNSVINAVSAARSSLGMDCAGVVLMADPVRLKAFYAGSGRAAGRVENFEAVCRILEARRGEYDAVAISSIVDLPFSCHADYFKGGGAMINPWGGVEAMLTHAVTWLFGVPSAHAPTAESLRLITEDYGVVDPRMAAEDISVTFLFCALKGLQRSPRIVTDPSLLHRRGVLNAGDISCLVIPDRCIGLPTLAALGQGIQVIAVRENENLMQNDLTQLPWAPGQLHIADNYLEAAGVLTALRQGLLPSSVRRPLAQTIYEVVAADRPVAQVQAAASSEPAASSLPLAARAGS